jgi:hypothetical protein
VFGHARKDVFQELHGTDAVKADLLNLDLGLVLIRIKLVIVDISLSQC